MRKGWAGQGRWISATLVLALLAGTAAAQSTATPQKPAKPAKPTRTKSAALECAAFIFRGITTPGPDGVQEAGLYKSDLGRIGLEARVKGHAVVNYWLTLDSHIPPALDSLPPKALEPCLKAKGTTVRLAQQHEPCFGNRFKIVLTRTSPTAPQYLLLYSWTGTGGISARAWRFCRATVIQPTATAP
jgi:hypothetical protein